MRSPPLVLYALSLAISCSASQRAEARVDDTPHFHATALIPVCSDRVVVFADGSEFHSSVCVNVPRDIAIYAAESDVDCAFPEVVAFGTESLGAAVIAIILAGDQANANFAEINPPDLGAWQQSEARRAEALAPWGPRRVPATITAPRSNVDFTPCEPADRPDPVSVISRGVRTVGRWWLLYALAGLVVLMEIFQRHFYRRQ